MDCPEGGINKGGLEVAGRPRLDVSHLIIVEMTKHETNATLRINQTNKIITQIIQK